MSRRLIATSVTRLLEVASPSNQQISEAVQAAAVVCELTVADIHVVICDDEEIAGVHGEFFNDPTPTDVITFPIEGDGSVKSPLSGELLVSAETADRAAAEHGHSAETEILLYVIHGVLHLGGFDDRDADSRSEMRAAERRALQSLGLEVHYFE